MGQVQVETRKVFVFGDEAEVGEAGQVREEVELSPRSLSMCASYGNDRILRLKWRPTSSPFLECA